MRGNHGYAAAVNVAASASDADYVILLNPDVEVPQPASLVQLVDHLQNNPSAAIAAPRLLNADGSVQESARCIPTVGMLAARQTPLGRTKWGRRRAERYLELPNVPEGHSVTEWALGAAMAIRRSDFNRVGGFDDRFFLYFEDVDFCSAWPKRAARSTTSRTSRSSTTITARATRRTARLFTRSHAVPTSAARPGSSASTRASRSAAACWRASGRPRTSCGVHSTSSWRPACSSCSPRCSH